MLPVIDPPSDTDGSASVVGVLLAAGTSSRFGKKNKLLVQLEPEDVHNDQSYNLKENNREPVIRHSAHTLLDAGLECVWVVVGHESNRIRRALSGLDVGFIENPAYKTGHGSSIRAGAQAINTKTLVQKSVDAVVFGLGDMPYVKPDSVRALIRAYENGAGSALAAGYENQRGNPVLFDKRHFTSLISCEKNKGGKEVLLSAPDGAVIETNDPGVQHDIDKQSDIR